jgi:hypothetical protein
MRRSIRWLLICALPCIVAGCDNGGSADEEDATTTAPSTAVTTESFTGTVEVSGESVNVFNVALSGGQVNVILTAAGPPSTIYMGVGVGSYSNSTCTPLSNGSVVTQAGSTAQLTGTLNAGSYCVRVYDAGNQSAPVSYSVTVTHY